MYSVRQIVGKAIVSVDDGARLGTVADGLLEDGSVRLVALVIGGGLLGKEHVVPFRDVQKVGDDTVLVRSQSGVIGVREWRDSGVHATRSSALKGRAVVTASGRRIGEVNDFLIDEQTGAFDALEIAASDLGGLRTKRSLVRPGPDIRIGPDAIVVPESAVEEMQSSDREQHARD